MTHPRWYDEEYWKKIAYLAELGARSAEKARDKRIAAKAAGIIVIKPKRRRKQQAQV
jgi:hypothetical protein